MNELRQSFTNDLQSALAGQRVAYLEIDEASAGQRIDNFLIRIAKGVPKSHLYRILRSGEVRVNKGRVDATYRLQIGDVLRIPPLRLAASANQEALGQRAVPTAVLPVLFEDAHLLVIDKPAGIAVHGGSGVSFGVIEALRHLRPDAKFLELVHRLDRETSGLLLLAKKRSALVHLHEQIRLGSIEKRYLACVKGAWRTQRQHLKFPLFKYTTADGERRVRVQEDGLLSHTIVTKVEGLGDYTLLDAELRTGRTHQIRVHLAHSGFPIVGDDKYGDFALNKALARAGSRPGIKRMFLHAHRIAFKHPDSGQTLVLEAPLHGECQQFLSDLRAASLAASV